MDRFTQAKEKYANLGVDAEKAIETLKSVSRYGVRSPAISDMLSRLERNA